MMGANARARGNRSRSIGWKPVKTTKDFFESIKPEVPLLVKKSDQDGRNAGALAAKLVSAHVGAA